jgi:type I restriction enzyme M protein
MTHSQITSVIWSAADLIRDTFKDGKYQDVVLRLTVPRRIREVVEPKGEKVLNRCQWTKTNNFGAGETA